MWVVVRENKGLPLWDPKCLGLEGRGLREGVKGEGERVGRRGIWLGDEVLG